MLRLFSFAIFGVIFLAALLLTYFILIIDKIEVYGCERFTEEAILAASGLHTGQHMWLANLDAAVEAVEEDPYIASLEITRVYPDRLVLRVTERVEKAVILGMNTHAVIDGEGYVLSIGTRASYEGLLKVYGTGAGGYHVNQRLGEESDFPVSYTHLDVYKRQLHGHGRGKSLRGDACIPRRGTPHRVCAGKGWRSIYQRLQGHKSGFHH